MSVRTRLLVVATVAAIVEGLILAGCSPTVAVTVASGIVLVSREVWMPAGPEGRRRAPRKRTEAPSPESENESNHSG